MLFRMSAIERNELITYLHCMYLVYFRPHGHMRINSGIAPVSLHFHEAIGDHNNYRKLTSLKMGASDLNTVDQRHMKWVLRLNTNCDAAYGQ